ncbi:MAG: response regulator FixJ [Pseudaminobacter sp.]
MQADPLVHVIDDDDEVRRSLAFLLVAAGMQARVHESATAFLEVLPGIRSGCVVTDVWMPDMTGIDLLRHLRAEEVGLPVIVMTGQGDVPLAVEAMKIGAHDFLEKPFDDDTLLASVRRALGAWERDARHTAERLKYRSRLAALSGRERNVFDGLVAGHPNKVIAHMHGISPRTVEIYRANVMSKMKASSLSELVRMAMIVRPPGEETRQ